MKRENITIKRILNALDYLTIQCKDDYYTAVVVEYNDGDGLDWVTCRKGDDFKINSWYFEVQDGGKVDLKYAQIYGVYVHNWQYTPEGHINIGKTIKTF
jgi:hypothetical protein